VKRERDHRLDRTPGKSETSRQTGGARSTADRKRKPLHAECFSTPVACALHRSSRGRLEGKTFSHSNRVIHHDKTIPY
jgi:hypothetical protein